MQYVMSTTRDLTKNPRNSQPSPTHPQKGKTFGLIIFHLLGVYLFRATHPTLGSGKQPNMQVS